MTASGCAGSVSSQSLEGERMEGDIACRQDGRLPGAGQRVGAPAADLARGERRRQLELPPEEPGQRGLHGGTRGWPAGSPASARPRGRRSSRRHRSRRSRGRPCGRRDGTRPPASPGPGRGAARPTRTGRASRRGRSASCRRDGAPGRRCRATSARPACRPPGCRPGARRSARSAPVARRVGDVDRGPRPSSVTARPPARTAPLPAGRLRAASASGSGSDAPAARGWPPPPQVPHSAVASTPPGFVRTERRVAPSFSLNRRAISAVSDCARRSMMPSECSERAPVAARSASSSVEAITSPPACDCRRARTRPNSASWASGLVR